MRGTYFVLAMTVIIISMIAVGPVDRGKCQLNPNTIDRIWEHTRNGSDATLWKVAWSPDGELVAATFFDNHCLVMNASDGEVVTDIDLNTPETRCDGFAPPGTNPLRACAFSPDGKYLALGGDDMKVVVLNVGTWDRKYTFPGHTGSICCLDFSPDSRYLASGSGTDKVIPQNAGENQTRIWDMETGSQVLILKGHRDGVLGVKWSPDGGRLATASDDRSLRVWSFPDGEEIMNTTGHTSGLLDVDWSPDGNSLITGSRDYKIKVWNSTTGEELATWSDYNCVRSVDIHPTEELAATSGVDLTLKIRDLRTGTELKRIKDGMEQNAMVMSSRWSPDGTRIVSGLGKSHSMIMYGFGIGNPSVEDEDDHTVLTITALSLLTLVFLVVLFYPAVRTIRRQRP